MLPVPYRHKTPFLKHLPCKVLCEDGEQDGPHCLPALLL